MEVAICGPNLRDQSKGQLHVHALGCADLAKGAVREPEYREHLRMDLDADDRREVVEAVYPPEDFGYTWEDDGEMYLSEFHFFPCCDALAVEADDEDVAEEVAVCDRCGEPIDYCQGHGPIHEALGAGVGVGVGSMPSYAVIESGLRDQTLDQVGRWFVTYGEATGGGYCYRIGNREMSTEITTFSLAVASKLLWVLPRDASMIDLELDTKIQEDGEC